MGKTRRHSKGVHNLKTLDGGSQACKGKVEVEVEVSGLYTPNGGSLAECKGKIRARNDMKRSI